MDSIANIPFVAGNAALDFVNTAEERGHPDAREFLSTPDDLLTWGRRYGLLSRSARPATANELTEAKQARELIHALVTAKVAGRRPRRSQLQALQRRAAEAYATGSLHQTDGALQWRWSQTDPATVRHVAVTSALALLAADTGDRLKECPGEHCGWLFLDTTKRGNRRWCSMNECGQDAKDEARRLKRQRAGR